MTTLWSNVGRLDSSFALLLFVAGAVFGLFGWRLIRALVTVESLLVACLLGYYLSKSGGGDSAQSYTFMLGLAMAVAMPFLAWRFPKNAAVLFYGLIGFATAALLLYDIYVSDILKIAFGFLVAGGAMALGLTMFRQTTVVMTGVHGAWLCALGLAIVASHPSNFITDALHSLHASFDYTIAAFVVVFSVIMIAIQWIDMEGQTADQYN